MRRDNNNFSEEYINQQLVEISNIVCKTHDVVSNLISNTAKSIIEFSSIITSFIQGLDLKNTIAISQIDNEYNMALFQAEWFPYAGWDADVSILWEVKSVIDSSKKDSARRKHKIDKILFSYYTDKELKIIAKKLNKNTLISPVHKRIIKQAIQAYFRKEYAITTVMLSSLWQTLIYLKSGNTTSGHKENQSKQYFEDLVKQKKLAPQFNDYFSNFVMAACYGNNDVNPDVPMRNANAHGWYNKYPTKKAALNAILLTDFILEI